LNVVIIRVPGVLSEGERYPSRAGVIQYNSLKMYNSDTFVWGQLKTKDVSIEIEER